MIVTITITFNIDLIVYLILFYKLSQKKVTTPLKD